MAETAWTEEGPSAPPKKKIPTWLWFCGGGCLLAVLGTIVVVGFGAHFLKTAMDPELQKKHLAEILPFDEWPEQMEPIFGMQMGIEQYQFKDSRGFTEQIQHHKGRDGTEGRKKLFETLPPQFPKDLMVMKFEDVVPSDVEVQGRDLHVLRMRMEFSGFLKTVVPAEARDQLGSMAFVDLTPAGQEGMLLLQLTRMKGADPISDDEIREILKPFHIGPKR